MEFACQFFADPKQVVRVYIALQDDVYRYIAQDLLGFPIISLNEFVLQNGNVFIYESLSILYIDEHLYVSDEKNNYVKICTHEYTVGDVYVNDIDVFNTTMSNIQKVFIELYLEETVLDFSDAQCYYRVAENTYVPITLGGFAMYDKTMHELSDGRSL